MNSVTQWTCSTAESAVTKAVEVGKPIVQGLEGPIKKVDGVLCSGLDYVESKVPAVKLPPGEVSFYIYIYFHGSMAVNWNKRVSP